ncbi:hypothetical protein CUJ89_29970 [Burkholderia pyrrocinia]|uniref:Uncharacterized protein n=1 Tax=Burkholderia pyrrocinia TaxID=60550 RepID=A0A2Z5N4M1_BURPY|nr:hypothetical protein [Burkholderia pyrrocinia]AXF24509.1 hypothetical protein CUJ89_29970 [Burkholderia pyrrocinia]
MHGNRRLAAARSGKSTVVRIVVNQRFRGKDESHVEKHFFDVDAWTFDPATSQYKKRFSYRTAKRYDRGEGSDHVLTAERGEILRRLAASK